MNPLILIGGAVALLYLLRNRGAGAQDYPGYNPEAVIQVRQVNQNGVAEMYFGLKPRGKEFKNNRVAGGIYLGNQKIADFREAQNFTVRNQTKGVLTAVRFPAQYAQAITSPEFWQNARAVGNFEAQNKERIDFDNPIEGAPGIAFETAVNIDFAKLLGGLIG